MEKRVHNGLINTSDKIIHNGALQRYTTFII